MMHCGFIAGFIPNVMHYYCKVPLDFTFCTVIILLHNFWSLVRIPVYKPARGIIMWLLIYIVQTVYLHVGLCSDEVGA